MTFEELQEVLQELIDTCWNVNLYTLSEVEVDGKN